MPTGSPSGVNPQGTEIAGRPDVALKLQLLPGDSELAGPTTKDAGAYGLYLQGVGVLLVRAKERLRDALADDLNNEER